MEQGRLRREDLETMDVSLIFLFLIIFSVLLSLWSALIQREQLRLALDGRDDSHLPSAGGIRLRASSITVGCLGFFLCLALETRRRAQAEGTATEQRSAQANVWASLLVLLSAILRLVDLKSVMGAAQTPLLEETTFPD